MVTDGCAVERQRLGGVDRDLVGVVVADDVVLQRRCPRHLYAAVIGHVVSVEGGAALQRPLCPYTTLFRSVGAGAVVGDGGAADGDGAEVELLAVVDGDGGDVDDSGVVEGARADD